MSSIIGYNNLVKSGTVTSSGDASGYEKENAKSWKTSTWWKADAAGVVYFYVDMGSAVDVDCWGMAGHNLADNAGTVLPEYSATGAWAGEELPLDTLQTPDNVTVFRKVTSVNARYFRYEVNSTTNASLIGNFFLGEYLQLERGMPRSFSPANLNSDRKIINNKSNSGAFLGRVVKYNGSKVRIEQKSISRAWIDASWKALADSIELYPFYFLWNDVDYPAEAAYCLVDRIRYPKYSDSLNLSFTLDCMALYDL